VNRIFHCLTDKGRKVVCPWLLATRVPGLPIRDCARGCTNSGQSRPMMSAIDVTAKTFFERLYLVLGLGTFGPSVNYPCAPTTPTVHSTTISRFLCNFFPRMAHHFVDHHDSPSNLANSQFSFSLLASFFCFGPVLEPETVEAASLSNFERWWNPARSHRRRLIVQASASCCSRSSQADRCH